MSLENWVKLNKLKPEPTSPTEIKDLLAVIDRDLKDCQVTVVSIDQRFKTAYEAALISAKAALRASGYRTGGGGLQHHDLIFSLPLTIGAEQELVIRFQALSKKRHQASYEVRGAVSEQELEEMIELARYLRESVQAWLKANRPELLGN